MKNHCCFCVQLTLILSAIASTLAFGQTVLTVDGTKGVTAEGVNGVFNPNICSVTPAPSWCSGSDIGAWTNAAIGQLSGSCGEIYIPAGSYTYTTTIVKPRCVKIHGASAESTILNWNLSTGWAVAVNDSSSPTAYPEGDIADLTLDGPGTTGNNGGIYFGGTDQLAGFTGTVSTSGTAVTGTGFSTTTWTGGTPVLILVSSTWTQFVISTVNSSTSITLTTSAGTNTNVGMTVVGAPSTTVAPSANYGDHQNVNRVRIINFGAGEMWGENAWSTTTDQSVISNNGMNAYFPVNESSNNSGERINFVDSSIQNALRVEETW